MTRSRPASPPGIPEVVAIAAILMATVALSIDIVLPALSDMAADLAVSGQNQRQWIVTALFVGLTFGQLLFGPLSDSIGRKPAILAGISVFVLGSLICATSRSFETMMAGRLVQGLGAAGPRIVTVALIRDRFEGAAMARIMSLIMGVFILVPVLAPALGQAILVVLPWRGLFVVLSAISLAGGTWLVLRLPETLSRRKPFDLRAIGSDSAFILTRVEPMAYTLAGACCYGALMGYINSSQQLFQDLYDVGDLYAVVFGLSAAFISAATLANARLVTLFAMRRICIYAIAALLVWSALFILVLHRFGTPPPLWLWLAFNCPCLFALGLTFGNFNAIALQDLGHLAGLASAIFASIMSAGSLVIAATIGLNFDMTPGPIVLGYAGFGALALGLMRFGEARRHRTAPVRPAVVDAAPRE